MFCTQDNQYFSPAVPGTREKLNEILDSPLVKWKIETIRAVRKPEAMGKERGIPEVLPEGGWQEAVGRDVQGADGRREVVPLGKHFEGVAALPDLRGTGG